MWKSEIDLADLNAQSAGTMAETLGIQFTEIGPDYLKASMPFSNATAQPFGIMHGGAFVALAETVGSVAGLMSVDAETTYCVGLDISANHTRAVRSGLVVATASPLHVGRLTQVWEIKVTDEDERLCSISRLTLSNLAKRV